MMKNKLNIIDKFCENYHCPANYAVIPRDLNLWRGAISKDLNDHFGKGQCDYFDIFLDLVRSYYLNLNVPEDAKNQFINHQDWFNFFGNGEEGWYSFVDYYHFNPYVNDKYEVKDLFAPYEQYSKEECNEIVGTYHGWDYCLPRCSKDDQTVPIIEAKNRAYNYAVNSLWIWKQRSKLLETFIN